LRTGDGCCALGTGDARQPTGITTASRLLASSSMRAVLACALLGCAYRPGSYAHDGKTFPGQHVTLGCLDLSVERRDDTPSGAVLEFQFGNRCDHATPIAIASVARGRGEDGRERRLSAYDPKHEIRSLAIDGRMAGTETIEYRADDGTPITQICIDAAAVAGESPARWLCFGGAPSS
jgi:hypothetical protein